MKHTRFSCWLKYGALALGGLGFFAHPPTPPRNQHLPQMTRMANGLAPLCRTKVKIAPLTAHHSCRLNPNA